jgi:hypothetical protein
MTFSTEHETLLNELKDPSEEINKLLFKEKIYKISLIVFGLVAVVMVISQLSLLIYFTTPETLQLHQTIKAENIMSHLQEFQTIAQNYSGW